VGAFHLKFESRSLCLRNVAGKVAGKIALKNGLKNGSPFSISFRVEIERKHPDFQTIFSFVMDALTPARKFLNSQRF
jgi:hypothetical protein